MSAWIRIGVSMTKDGHKKLGELAESLKISQSALLESLVWIVGRDSEMLSRIRDHIEEKTKVEEALRDRLRGLSPEQAKSLLTKLDKSK